MTDWTGVIGQYPDNPEFLPMPTCLEDEPLALWAFRQDDMVNRGYPYLILFPDLIRLELNPVRQREYICVYDMLSEKQAFLTNGLEILNPTSAVIHEVLNGEYSLTLTHPIDEDGKWRYIRESNIIKCQGQLFTIKRCEWSHSSECSGTVTAYCEHIFYQLADAWIYSGFDYGYDSTDTPTFAYCINAINSIMDRYVTLDPAGSYRYDYDWSSNWEWGASGWTLFVDGGGTTPIELLIGSGGILDQKGGELYRNNFHFSINERMEAAEDNAFDLRFGENMSGFRRTIDTSTLALHFRLDDQRSHAFVAVSYADQSFPFFQFPHNVVRSDTVQYEEEWYERWFSGELGENTFWARMFQDLFARYKNTSTPIICYEIDVKDLKNVYPELTNHYHYKVGNTGRIIDTLIMGSVTLKITETEVDGITGECTRIVIGSKNSFTRGAGYPLELNTQPAQMSYELALFDSRGKALFDSREKQICRKGVI